MSRPAVLIDHLRVRRHSTGAAALELKPGPGVNLLCGPNASGKSTIAAAITSALWPSEADADLDVTLGVRLGTTGSQETVRLSHGRLTSSTAHSAAHVPPSHRSRYALSLGELLTDDGRDFAAQVQRESIGGHDLEAVRRALGFTAPPLTRNKGAYKDEVRARRLARERAQAHEALQAQERHQLAELRRRLEATEAAATEAQLVRAQLHAAAQAAALDEAQRTLQGFDSAISRLEGGEVKLVEQAITRREREADRLADAEASLTQTLAHLELLGDAVVVGEGVRAGLDAALEQLRASGAARLATERERAAATSALDAFDWTPATPPAPITEEALQRLDEQARAVHLARADLLTATRAEEAARLAIERARTPTHPTAALDETLRALTAWLAVPEPPRLVEVVREVRLDAQLPALPALDPQPSAPEATATTEARLPDPPRLELEIDPGLAARVVMVFALVSLGAGLVIGALKGGAAWLGALPPLGLLVYTFIGAREPHAWEDQRAAHAEKLRRYHEQVSTRAAEATSRRAAEADAARQREASTMRELVSLREAVLAAAARAPRAAEADAALDDQARQAQAQRDQHTARVAQLHAQRAGFQEEIQRLGAVVPDVWTPEHVMRARDAALIRWRDASLYEQLKARHERAAEQVAPHRQRLDAAQSRFTEALHTLGLADADQEAVALWYARQAAHHQQLTSRATATTAAAAEAERQHAEAFDRVCAQLTRTGITAPTRPEDAAAAVADLYERAQQQTLLLNEKTRHEQTIQHARGELGEAARQLHQIFSRLGIEADVSDPREPLDAHLTTLRQWSEAFESWQHALAQVRTLETSYQAAIRALPADARTIEQPELEARLRELDDQLATHDSLLTQITTIQTRLDTARYAQEVERAQAEHAESLDALAQWREEATAQTIGAWLIDHLTEATAERERPEVFHRARALFALMTHGRYRLHLDAARGWLAYDERLGVMQPLGSLSSASRVQLLLAVRVAFIEQLESGPQLPLLLDEVLAHSDGARMEGILDALLVLAGAGRQVFIMTARAEDVALWQQAHARAQQGHTTPPPLHILQLSEDDAVQPQPLDAPVIPQRATATTTALDDVTDHRSMGEALGIRRPFHPRSPARTLPLWFLVEDVEALRRLHHAHLRTWGQLDQLASVGGAHALGLDEASMRRWRALARAADARAEAWSVGRGAPLTRADLEASGAISENFMEDVSALADELGGDAEALLLALESKQVARFRQNKADELRDYCTAHGHLSEEEPLTGEAIWARILAALTDELAQGTLDPETLHTFITRLDHPTSAPAHA